MMNRKQRLRFALLPVFFVALLSHPLSALPPATATGEKFATALPAVRMVELTGFTRPLAKVHLVAEVAGRMEQIHADIGQAIPRDGIFAKIDDTFLQLDLDELLVQAEHLESQVAFARREVERHKELARQKNTSAAQLDTIEQSLRDNTYALRAIRIKQQVLEERLRRTHVRAPAGWLVTARSVEPSQWVHEGEVIAEVANFSSLLVPFALTPEQFAALTTTVASLEGLHLNLLDLGIQVRTNIQRANPDFDLDTRKILVELRIDTPLPQQHGNLRARLALPLPERIGTVLLPATAVEERYEELWVTREDGIRIQVMRLGVADDQNPEMLRLTSSRIRVGDRFRLRE